MLYKIRSYLFSYMKSQYKTNGELSRGKPLVQIILPRKLSALIKNLESGKRENEDAGCMRNKQIAQLISLISCMQMFLKNIYFEHSKKIEKSSFKRFDVQ